MPTFQETYTIGAELGKGAYATVYRCTHKTRGDVLAVKAVDKSKAGPKDINDVMHEVNVMKQIGSHNNVVSLIDYYDSPNHMYLVMEILEGGMLFDRIVQCKHYSESSASRLVKNFLLALQHIHSKGIMHRDLKPENLLLKKKVPDTATDVSHLTDLALADFGLAGRAPGTTCCGSPSYIAPEVINVGYLRSSKDPYDAKCDIWSLGVITYILLSGKMPFHGKNYKETFNKIVKGQWAFVGEIWNNSVSDTAKNFIKTMMNPDPKTRPSAEQALKHPWIVDVQSDLHLMASIEGIKQFNAEQKLRAAMNVFRATNALFGRLDMMPPFMKYLSHENKLSTVIKSMSQTDKTKVHHIDFSRALLRETPKWTMRDCCTCGSEQVCRHIQNVHEYLYVGNREMEVFPFINDLEQMKAEKEIDLLDDPKNAEIQATLAEIKDALKAAQVFHEEYLKVPQGDFKPNFMLKDSGAPKPLLNPFMKKK